MPLSKEVISTLVDLVENKLAVMQVGGREDLREIIILQHCLGELRGLCGDEIGSSLKINSIPHRGRRRKLGSIIEEMREAQLLKQA